MSTKSRDHSTDPHTVRLGSSRGSRLSGSRSATPSLVVIRGERLGARLDLSASEAVVIGRGSECDFLIADRSVSRQHCKLFSRDDGVWAEDLGSTNHSFVNDQPIQLQRLVDSDQLRVGKTVFKFLDVGNPEAGYLAELHDHAVRDGLTGLFNRRHATIVLTEEFRRSRQLSEASLVLAIIDIDWFKKINDEAGHLAGDAVLVQLSQVLGATLRAGDTLARIGGEEFALIMPDTGLDEAHRACDRLRQRVAEHEFRVENGQRFEVTISIGLAEVERSMKDYSELLAEADRRLYCAKLGGRNRVNSQSA